MEEGLQINHENLQGCVVFDEKCRLQIRHCSRFILHCKKAPSPCTTASFVSDPKCLKTFACEMVHPAKELIAIEKMAAAGVGI